jgi:hypothetical protein
MAVAALKHKPKTFYATMRVTRVEDWFVEAETTEEGFSRVLVTIGE